MKRRLMQLVFALGLFLTLAGAVLYVRSFWVYDAIRVVRGWADGDWRTYSVAYVAVNCGEVRIALRTHRRTLAQTLRDTDNFQPTGLSVHRDLGDADPSYVRRADAGDPPWERLGFHYHTEAYWLRQTPGETEREFDAPAWFVLLVFAALTAVPYASLRRDRRRRTQRAAGQCVSCGYDLHGTEHDRCPECGAGVLAAAA